MKIRVLSDIHLEFSSWTPPRADEDVVVLAGDICTGAQGLKWARDKFGKKPILYVPGNHEYYGEDIRKHQARLRIDSRKFDITLLDWRSKIIHDVRFIGATLWSDFSVGEPEYSQKKAATTARSGVSDFESIRSNGAWLTPADTIALHHKYTHFLAMAIAEPFEGPTVVVTHHAPHKGSIPPGKAAHPLIPNYVSDLSDSGVFGPPVRLWIHGHVHLSLDYEVNGTRIVCNPRGYIPDKPNPEFRPSFIVEV